MSLITKYLHTVFTIIFFVLPAQTLAYEPTSTHAGLSQEIVEFYNANHTKRLSSNQKELIIKGSIEEDDPALRVINHFYDPIYGIGINNSRTAPDWAINDNPENQYSWPMAIRHYAEGREDEAFLALGHILHLIEDMSVPDHTRNDPHIGVGAKGLFTGESPFESWTGHNKDRDTMRGLYLQYLNRGEQQKSFNNLVGYFDFLANYSNKSFFSNDTITSNIYKEPIVVNVDSDYGYSIDKLNNQKFKITKRNKSKNGNLNFLLITDNDSSVISGYFDRLSKQAILTGAGVIDLFFKEAELARIDFIAKQKAEHSAEVAKAVRLNQQLSQSSSPALVARGLGFIVSDNIVSPVSKTAVAIGGSFITGANIIKSSAVNVGSMVAYTSSALAKSAMDKTTALVIAGYNNSVSLLKNLGSSNPATAVLSDKQILEIQSPKSLSQSKSNLIYQTPSPGPNIAPISPDPSVAQPNLEAEPPSGESLEFDSEMEIVDEDNAEIIITTENIGEEYLPIDITEPEIPAQNISPKQTEKDNLLYDSAFESVPIIYEATPLPESHAIPSVVGGGSRTASVAPVPDLEADDDLDFTVLSEEDEVPADEDTSTSTEEESDIVDDESDDTSTTTPDIGDTAILTEDTPTLAFDPAVLAVERPVIINELAWGGTSANSEDEWIELYNRSAEDVDLKDFVLYSKTDGSPYIKLSGVIPARGYFLIEAKNTGEEDEATEGSVKNITADLWTSFGARLVNTGENLILSYASTTIDEIPYCYKWCGVPTTRTTERYDPDSASGDGSSWSANNGVIYNGVNSADGIIYGTPRARNSLNYLISKNANRFSNLILTKANSPYLVNDTTQAIAEGGVLTIEPGVVIKFKGRGRLVAEGDIVANGTAEDPIVFTSFEDDEYGGNMDGVVTAPYRGSWYGVEIDDTSAGSSFTHTIFRYGGRYSNYGGPYKKAMLYVGQTSSPISNSVFEYSRGYGLYIEKSNSTVSNNIFRYNTGEGISTGLYIYQGVPNISDNIFTQNNLGLGVIYSTASVLNNNFSDNATAVSVNGVPGVIEGNNGLDGDVIKLAGSITAIGATTTLTGNPMPYFLDGSVSVLANSTLDIKEGTVFKNSTIGSASALVVAGRLNIDTSTTSGVVFSSNISTSTRGGWKGITMNPGSSSKIKGATIQNATIGIKYSDSPINLEDVIFSTNGTAMKVMSTSPIIKAENIIFINNGVDKSPTNLW